MLGREVMDDDENKEGRVSERTDGKGREKERVEGERRGGLVER